MSDKELMRMLQQMANDIDDIKNAIVKEQNEPQISKRADYADYLEKMKGRENNGD